MRIASGYRSAAYLPTGDPRAGSWVVVRELAVLPVAEWDVCVSRSFLPASWSVLEEVETVDSTVFWEEKGELGRRLGKRGILQSSASDDCIRDDDISGSWLVVNAAMRRSHDRMPCVPRVYVREGRTLWTGFSWVNMLECSS